MAHAFSKAVVALAAVAGLGTAASAEVLLTYDVSVPNQVTLTATTGNSAASVITSNFTGYLLANFFTADQAVTSTLVSGNLTTFSDPSDNSPALFRSGSTDAGLNVWSFTTATNATFTAGAQAFTGSATWTLTPAVYASFLSANTSGTIYAPADDSTDISSATAIGEYSIVPAPGAIALMGMGGLLVSRRRR